MNTVTKKELFDVIERDKEELFSFLSSLIRIDSQNFGATGREYEIAFFLKDAYEKIGKKAETYSPLDVPGLTENIDYYDGRSLKDRLNVSVVIPGEKHDRRLMIASHDDTVPIGNPENWFVDPLGGEIRDGKIWGRGACDDKYGLAAAWFLVKKFDELGIRLPYDLVVTAYCDEEFGGGNGALAASLKYPSDDILNLDCKNLDIWAAGAGGGEIRGCVRSLNPLDSCEKLLDGLQIVREELAKFREDRRQGLMNYELFRNSVIPDTALRYMEMNEGGNLSLNVANIRVVFYTCENETDTKKAIQALNEAINCRLAPLDMSFDGFKFCTRFFRFARSASENPAMDLMTDSIREVTGRESRGIGSCLSDMPLFINHGSPRAFSFGAGRDFNADGGAHQPNEFIECGDFLDFTRIVGAFLLGYGN